jgi:hypothetical protein
MRKADVFSTDALLKFRPDCESMNRVVSTILMPLLLVSQSLFSMPHSHAGSSIAEPDGHAARPHVHLHGADHHHGHHHHDDDGSETPTSTGEQVPDHDSDAVYVGEKQLIHDGKVAKVAKSELTGVYFDGGDSSANAGGCRRCSHLTSPPVLHPKCSLYLQCLSIRC